MLEAIRERAQGWIAKVILGLIIVPFAIWGVDSYFQGGGNEPPLATVGKDEISQREFFRALQNQRDRLQQNSQVKIDIENKEFRKFVLDDLIELWVAGNSALANGLVVPAGQAEAVIHSVPIFQVDGAFSEPRYKSWLREQGMSERDVLSMIERESLAQQVQFGYGQGAVVPMTNASRLAALLARQREVNELFFPAQAYLGSVKVGDEAVKAEYEAKKSDFATPALVRIQYLELSADAIRNSIKVTREQAKAYYESNKANYQEPEQRQASHILILTDKSTDKAQAKAKAEDLLKQAKADPAKFAELAKTHSQDPGSAQQGGDLGSFTRDTMVKPFADAVFGMNVGEIRGPVESEFGFHIIRLDGVTPGKATPFEVLEAEITATVAQREANREFAEVADRFSNLVYEQPESLEPAAKEFGLSLKQTDWISRDKAEPAYLGNANLMDAVFSPEALEKKQNTEAVEISTGVLVAARVLEHKPAGVRPFAEVAESIRDRLLLKAARAQAVTAGQAALKRMDAGQTVPGLSAPMLVSRMRPLNLSPEVIKAVFKANTAKLPVSVGVEVEDGFRTYRINRVIDVEQDEKQSKSIQRDLTRLMTQAEMRAYLDYAKTRLGVEVNNALLEKKAE